MPRWAKVVGWLALLWTAGLVGAALIVELTGGCGEVRPADLEVCELDRDSTVSGLALIWFIGFLPAAVAWSVAWARPERCRFCGDELGAGEQRVCARCRERLMRSAEPGAGS